MGNIAVAVVLCDGAVDLVGGVVALDDLGKTENLCGCDDVLPR